MAGPGLYANIHAKRKRGGKKKKRAKKANGGIVSGVEDMTTMVIV